jgi:hypothetical protein
MSGKGSVSYFYAVSSLEASLFMYWKPLITTRCSVAYKQERFQHNAQVHQHLPSVRTHMQTSGSPPSEPDGGSKQTVYKDVPWW